MLWRDMLKPCPNRDRPPRGKFESLHFEQQSKSGDLAIHEQSIEIITTLNESNDVYPHPGITIAPYETRCDLLGVFHLAQEADDMIVVGRKLNAQLGLNRKRTGCL